MYVQSFNTIEAKLVEVRDTKLLVFCKRTGRQVDPRKHSFCGLIIRDDLYNLNRCRLRKLLAR